MSRPEPLRPVYDFSSAPNPVVLLRGRAEVRIRDDLFSGEAELVLRFSPAPRLVFHAKISMPEGKKFLSLFGDSIESSFLFNGQSIVGFEGAWKASADVLDLNWHPESEPVALCDMESKTSVAAIFHLFNFPDFRGGLHQDAAPSG
ncbi:MAG TPA: hypothetical protein VIK69_00860, partial [Methylophilaceae bacterium]